MKSKYEEQIDDNDSICPYCHDRYQVEAEDYDENEREVECDNCGKKYWLMESFSVTHNTRPDCQLNGTEHDFELITLRDGAKVFFCKICDECKLHEE